MELVARRRRGPTRHAPTTPGPAAVSAILTIAGLTIVEASRRRILWVLFGLTLLTVALTTWGVERLVSLARAGSTNELQIVARRVAGPDPRRLHVQLRPGDDRRVPRRSRDRRGPRIGVAHAMLARPIRRADLVIGRWLGLVVIVVAYAAASGLLEIAAVGLVTGYAPPEPLVAVAFLCAQAMVLLTLALLLSTRTPAIAAGAICVVLSGSAGWPACSPESAGSSRPGRWSQSPTRRAGFCRPTGCGAARSTAWSHRSSCSSPSVGAERRRTPTRSSRRRPRRSSSWRGRSSGSRSSSVWQSSRCRAGT